MTFEPTKEGVASATLTLSHPEGGTYTCALSGEGTPPGRTGPIAVRAGTTAAVPFKNIFSSPVEFAFACEPAGIFTVPKAKEILPAKKAVTVSITYKPQAGQPTVGRLTVTALASQEVTDAAGATPLQWVHYLQGTD